MFDRSTRRGFLSKFVGLAAAAIAAPLGLRAAPAPTIPPYHRLTLWFDPEQRCYVLEDAQGRFIANGELSTSIHTNEVVEPVFIGNERHDFESGEQFGELLFRWKHKPKLYDHASHAYVPPIESDDVVRWFNIPPRLLEG